MCSGLAGETDIYNISLQYTQNPLPYLRARREEG